MAEFGFDASVSAPDATGVSRGFTSNKEAFAGLFENVGNLGIAAVKIADQNNLQNQTKQVEEGVSSILNDFGFRTEGNDTTGTPQELQGYAKQLAKTHKAYNSGALKESNFQIRIDALSRRVRAQYPGYNAEIDGIISQTLGRSTANDLRKTLVAEWEAEQEGLNSADKQFKSDVSQARENGALYAVFPEYDKLVAEGKTPSKEETYYRLGQYYGEKEKSAQGKRKLEYDEAERKATEQQRMDVAYEDVSQVSSQFIKTGTSGADFQRIMRNLTGKQAKDWSDTELQEVTGAFGQLEAAAKVQILERLNDPIYSKLTKTQRDELTSRALEPLAIMKEAIVAKDVGLINVFQTMNDTTFAKDVNTFLNLRDENGDLLATVGRNMKVATSLFGPDAVAVWQMSNPETQGKTNKALDAMMLSSLGKGTPIKDILKDAKKASTTIDGPATKAFMDKSVKLVLDPTVPQAGKEAAIKSLFGPGNSEFLVGFSDKVNNKTGKSDRMVAFERLMSPEVTKSVLDASKTNPELIENYKNSMGQAFQGLFKSDIDNMTSVSQFGDVLSFKYNPDSKRFYAVAKNNPGTIFGVGLVSPTAGIFYGINEKWNVSTAKKSMDNLNKYIQLLDPAMSGLGVDTSAALEELFTVNGAIGGGKEPGSLFTRLGVALQDVGKDAKGGGARGSVQVDKSNEGIFDTGGVVPESFSKAVDRVEGAGNYDTLFGHAQNADSPFKGVKVSEMSIKDVISFSKGKGEYGQYVKQQLLAAGKTPRVATPMGRYQIVGETLRGAVAELGIDPNQKFDKKTQDTIALYLAKERIGSADSMEGKIDELRQEWEGFKNIPDAELEEMINDLS